MVISTWYYFAVVILLVIIVLYLSIDSQHRDAYLVEINKPPPILIFEYEEPYDELNFCVPTQDNLYCTEVPADNIGKLLSEYNLDRRPCDPIARKIMGMTSIEKMTEDGVINVYDQHAKFTAEKAQTILYSPDCEVIKPKELFIPNHLIKEGCNYMDE